MRIVHARKKVFMTDHAFESKFVMLTWIYSILQWKKYKNNIVLYTDDTTLNSIKEFGFDRLYDEINTEIFETGVQCEHIDFRWFWAMPKILALHYETVHLGNDVVVADMDVVPMSDLSRFWVNAPVCVWSNKEYLEYTSTYPDIRLLSLPKNYTLPKWFTGKVKPLNTGIIHFKDAKLADAYCQEVFKYTRYNNNSLGNTDCVTMCNAEQRMLAEFLNHKHICYQTVQPINQGLINRNAFHTHGFKQVIDNDNGLAWNTELLYLIKQEDKEMYDTLIAHPMYKDEQNYFSENEKPVGTILQDYYFN